MAPQIPAAAWDFLLQLAGAARQHIEKEGAWPPTLVVIAPDRLAMAPCHGWSHETKYALVRAIGRAAAAMGPVAVAIVCDAYYRPAKKGQAPMPPSGNLADDPEALDAICLIVADRAGNVRGRTWPYQREVDGMEIVTRWLEEEEMPEGTMGQSPILAAFWQGVEEAS